MAVSTEDSVVLVWQTRLSLAVQLRPEEPCLGSLASHRYIGSHVSTGLPSQYPVDPRHSDPLRGSTRTSPTKYMPPSLLKAKFHLPTQFTSRLCNFAVLCPSEGRRLLQSTCAGVRHEGVMTYYSHTSLTAISSSHRACCLRTVTLVFRGGGAYSKICLATDCSDQGSLWFSSVPPTNVGYYHKFGHHRYLPHHFRVIIRFHPVIRH
jgi:hypothetical protein